MRLVFVSPAWRRFDVTRLALAQRAHLCGELAGRGLETACVVVADDDNLDIAREYGFDTVEQNNDYLGRRFNDGIEHACVELGADFVCVVGSDDWVHASLFDRLPADEADSPALGSFTGAIVWRLAPEAITGREIALVDLASARLQRCRVRGQYGVIPWVFPVEALRPSGFRPVNERQQRGIDGSLLAGLGVRPFWVFRDPHDLCRVDFKSSTNLNTFEAITGSIGYGDVETDPWGLLERRYPAELVGMAREVSESMTAVPA
jgi:hypothetical protein